MFEITGYVDRLSARPGETVKFMVNCEFESYQARLVRLICGDDSGHGPGYKDQHVASSIEGSHPGRTQTINAGSYIKVKNAAALDTLGSFTVAAMIWPTTPKNGEQTIIGKWDDAQKSGFELRIDIQGAVALAFGDGGGREHLVATGKPLVERNWYLIMATWNEKTREVSVCQQPIDTRYGGYLNGSRVVSAVPFDPQLNNQCALSIAASLRSADGAKDITHNHFNGKIDGPTLIRGAVEEAVQDVTGLAVCEAIAAWDFSRDVSSTRAVDTTESGLHGEVVNLPARGMTGWNWTGEEHCWKDLPDQYGAIHFHDDDVYDAGWETDFKLTVTDGLKPGLYAAHLTSNDTEMHIPFVVRPERGKEAKVAFLLPTFDHMAYGNEHMGLAKDFAEMLRGRPYEIWELYRFLESHPEYGKSLYDLHSDGSGVCYSSRLRPILQMRPKCEVPWATADADGNSCNAREFNFDTYFVDWLEHIGVDYNVITDEDLHNEGYECIEPYRVLITGAHPEYYTDVMLKAVEKYTDHGGRLMYLGANGFYWMVATNDDLPGVIEVRRFADATKTWCANPGEYYCSLSGEYGSLWRHHGKPPQKLAGIGFTSEGFDVSTYYERQADSHDPRVTFMFEGIEDQEILGDFGYHGGGAVGNEIDRADFNLGTPPHTLIVATGDKLSDLYYVTQEDTPLNAPGTNGDHPLNRCDMTFFETPNGGAVFSVGSIAYVGSIPWNNYDNNIAKLTENVLRRFMDQEPFSL